MYSQCYDQEISDDEFEVIDDLHSKLETLSITERNALFYVAGYVCKKENIFLSDPQNLEESEFTTLVSRGKLAYPSSDIFDFTLTCYAFFESSSPNQTCSKHLSKVFSLLYEAFLFDFSNKNSVIHRLVNTFMKGFVRKVNDLNRKSVSTSRKASKFSTRTNAHCS